MEKERKIVTVKNMTIELGAGFILYGIPYAILYYIIFNFILYVLQIESLVVTAILVIILQGLFAFLTWRWNISATFKKRTITKDKVSTVMRNLYIFTIIICVINALLNFKDVNKKVDEAISSPEISLMEWSLEGRYDEDEYKEQKDKTIKELKTKLYTYLAIVEVGLTIAYIAVVPLQKKKILEKAIDE